MEKILEILKGIRDDVDFEKEENLIDDNIIDSFDVVGIVSDLQDAFGIMITIDEMEPENFNSAKAIYELVERHLDED